MPQSMSLGALSKIVPFAVIGGTMANVKGDELHSRPQLLFKAKVTFRGIMSVCERQRK